MLFQPFKKATRPSTPKYMEAEIARAEFENRAQQQKTALQQQNVSGGLEIYSEATAPDGIFGTQAAAPIEERTIGSAIEAAAPTGAPAEAGSIGMNTTYAPASEAVSAVAPEAIGAAPAAEVGAAELAAAGEGAVSMGAEAASAAAASEAAAAGASAAEIAAVEIAAAEAAAAGGAAAATGGTAAMAAMGPVGWAALAALALSYA